MKILAQLIESEPLLKQNLIHIIQRNLINTTERSYRNTQEPDYIAGLAVHLPKDLFNLLTLLFADFEFAVTGMFCHQRPFADYGEKPRPEIGDLLIVIIHKDLQGNTYRNSVLFQAKLTDVSRINLQKDNSLHQLKLYTQWPDFQYYKAGFLSTQWVRITPKSVHPGAQYLIIDADVPSSVAVEEGSHIMTAVPNTLLYPRTDLAEQICDLLSFRTGRAIGASTDTNLDEWSRLIWNLIELGKITTFNRRNSGFRNQGRVTSGDGFAMHFATQSNASFMHNFFESFLTHQNESGLEHDEIGAVPVIVIESFETEESGRRFYRIIDEA